MAWCEPHIEFTKSVFFPGQEVTGRAWATTKQDMQARKVEITFMGKAVTAWNDGKKRDNKNVGSYKKSEEKIVEMKHEVWSPESSDNTFPSGEYEWHFSFELPKDCPTSFEGAWGFIRYSVLIHFDVPSYADTVLEKPITISSPVDLNAFQGAKDQMELYLQQPIDTCGCLPCFRIGALRRGTVNFTLSSPSHGVVPGQNIVLTGRIENKATRPIERVKTELFRRETYKQEDADEKGKKKAGSSKVRTERLAMKFEVFDVPIGGSSDFSATFEIPPTVSTIRNVKNIGVEYFVKITVLFVTYIMARSTAEINFVVGTVPIVGSSSSSVSTFESGSAAECWTNRMKEDFHPQYTYYGIKRVQPN